MSTLTSAQTAARAALEGVAAELDLDCQRVSDTMVTVTLPGTRKLRTECAWEFGRHAVNVRAFVARNPDENFAGVYRWLLERNLRMQLVAFAVDHLGDIYLCGRLPLEAVTAQTVDRLLGIVAETADDSFNTILELGFASSIRAEWAWRRSRGESTANLMAFRHLDPGPGEVPLPSRRDQSGDAS